MMGRVATPKAKTGGEGPVGLQSLRLIATSPPDLGFASATLPMKGRETPSEKGRGLRHGPLFVQLSLTST
jgi:hypothetical protein